MEDDEKEYMREKCKTVEKRIEDGVFSVTVGCVIL